MSGALRPQHIKGNTALDVILKAFLKNDLDSLSQEHKDILERISEVDNRIRIGYTVVKSKYDYLLEMDVEDFRFTRPYRKRELAEWQRGRFGVSLAQGYIDVEMAERFFLTTEKRPDKEFARGMMIHWGEEAMAEARHLGDFKAAYGFFKELAKIRGLDKDDEPDFDPERLMPIKTIIVEDPSVLGFDKLDNVQKLIADLNKELRGQSKSKDKMLEMEAEDIDFEGEDNGEF